jgi:hypothetical protein
MKNYVLGSFVALSLAVGGLLAADFWEKKKFTEWDEKEVAKMLNDSPWAKSFTVYLKGFGGGRGGAGMGGGMGGGGGRGGRGGGGMGGGMSGGMGEEGGGGMGGGGMGGDMGGGGEMGGVSSGIPVLMRWHTALPIKEAIVRARYGAEAGTSKEAAATLSRQEQVYVVGISGIPAKAITVKPDELKTHAELRIKGQPPIQAVQVQSEQQRATTILYLVFPKLQQGAREITVADNEVEVSLQLEAGKISRKFKLKDMVVDGKLEL